MENNEKDQIQLPDNAFTELKPGEEYKPVMEPGRSYPEVNLWSVTWGIIMAMLFSAAAAYLGLKVGQVFEAAIPIAIIAVGVSTATKRSKALGENVIIQSIGACSGTIVAGAIFTLPAIYILQAKYPEMSVSFVKVFMSSLLGGILGILFMIPFRKYFVKDMHGKYPFPEATATTQVLVSGAKGGSQAKPLLIAGSLGMALGALSFAICNAFGLPPMLQVVSIMIYSASFMFSWGPICWVLIAEIFPNTIRGAAVAIAVAFQWIFNFVVSSTFVPMYNMELTPGDGFGHTFAYALYGTICVIAAVFVWRMVPETKGKTLEDMTKLWKNK